MANEKNSAKKKFKRTLLHKIVNVFIAIIAGLLFLLIIFFGFSQTKTFRDYLKNEITEYISNTIDGNLQIESLEGSVLSSVILYNTNLISGKDTLFKADEVVIKTSPIHLFLKRILIRDFIFKNASFNLLEDKDGIWNIAKLSRPDTVDTTEDDVEKDKDSGPFPFSIQINNISLENFSFTRQTYENLNSKNDYKFLTTEDLQLKELYLNAKMFANLSTSTVKLNLNNLSVNPNFESFNLKSLSGQFEFTDQYAKVSNLYIVSDSSNISIDARIDELNLLGDVELRDFKEYPMQLKLKAYPIKFSDLYTFIEDIDFLNDKVFLDLESEGYFGDFNVNNLELSFLESYLKIKGKVRELHTPENLFLDVNIIDSKIVESDAHEIIKGLEIPYYDNLILENMNALFKGEPTRFHATISSDIKNGNIFVDTYLDLQMDQIEYDVRFNSENMDLNPIINLPTSITAEGTLVGTGTDPSEMKAELNLLANKSIIDSIQIDSLNLASTINGKIFNLDFKSIINGSQTTMYGDLDITNKKEAVYNLISTVENLELNQFTNNPADSSNLNLHFNAKGKNLDIDELVGKYELSIDSSYLGDLYIDETKISLDLEKNENERDINLRSEFANFNINGQFSLQNAIDILVYEGITISNVINKKIEELNPIDETDTLNTEEILIETPTIVKKDLEFSYSFVFKDFDLIAQILKNEELDIVGSGEGIVKNDSLNFEISTDIFIENLLNQNNNDLLYLSDVQANLNFSRDNRFNSLNKMFGSISIEGEKIYTGVELNDIQLDLVFNQSKLFFNSSLDIDNELYTEFEGMATSNIDEERIELSNISLNYKDLPWVNYDTCSVVFNEDGVQLSNLILQNGSTIVNLDGQINEDESHNLFLIIENMPGEVLSAIIFSKDTPPLGGDINLNLTSSQFLDNPELNLDLSIYNISYNNFDFGSLYCTASHSNSSTLVDIDFINPVISPTYPLLTLDASLPLNIKYIDQAELLSDTSNVLIALRSNNFDLATFGNTLPYFKDQSGNLISAIDISGPIGNLNSEGYLKLENGRFTFRENNLDYSLTVDTELKGQKASVTQFRLKNTGGSRYSGIINGSGTMELKKFPFSQFDFRFNGDLALLGRKSQTRTSTIYGDLFIKSDNEWQFQYNNDRYVFNGNIIVERADLVYVSKTDARNIQNGKVIYKIMADTTNADLGNQKFVRILEETRENSIDLTQGETVAFDLNTNILINNIAALNFVISPELNQKLNVLTTGQLQLETTGSGIRSQGSLSLLNGSSLEFFKTFDAVGTIRFENDITDPNFDITATYIGEISKFENTDNTEEVAVKLKLNTPFSKLQENISGSSQNLTVYVGTSNIENDVPDNRYDQSNALTFVILDQLSLDFNDEQKSTLGSMWENAAYSLLGSQLTTLLNSSLGGFISNIRLNKYSGRDSYKLLFSGKYNNIRYSFGGSFGSQTDYLQLSKADIKVEYLLNPNFLIRLEQKNPIIETSTEEKVQELGLKYKFEF